MQSNGFSNSNILAPILSSSITGFDSRSNSGLHILNDSTEKYLLNDSTEKYLNGHLPAQS